MYKMINKFGNSFGISFESFDDRRFDNVDQNLVRFFQTEYGSEWKIGLDHHLYQNKIKKDKKAA